MKRIPMATALRIHCAERTRAMQLVCMCASRLVPSFHRTFVSEMTWGTSKKRMPMATALRTRCAERTRATQLVCVYASDIHTCTVLIMEICVREDMEVQV